MNWATIFFHLNTLRESAWKRRAHPNLDGHHPDLISIRCHRSFVATAQMVDICNAWAFKTFTNEWFNVNMADVWQHYFFSESAHIQEALEVGSYEGRSTVCTAKLFPNARITCVDSFTGSDEHQGRPELLSKVEEAFEQNLAEFGQRIVKI